MIKFERCKNCEVPLLPEDKIHWCKVKGCPHTRDYSPTPEFIKMMGEKDGRAFR
jgi:hypothetical protein